VVEVQEALELLLQLCDFTAEARPAAVVAGLPFERQPKAQGYCTKASLRPLYAFTPCPSPTATGIAVCRVWRPQMDLETDSRLVATAASGGRCEGEKGRETVDEDSMICIITCAGGMPLPSPLVAATTLRRGDGAGSNGDHASSSAFFPSRNIFTTSSVICSF
jgi:hypothetical protein